MSIYFIRMIELLAVVSVKDEDYLYISLHTTTTKPIHVYWKIDASIAKQLTIYCDFHGQSRYRLSLRTHEKAGNLILGSVTKTYLTTSEHFELFVTEHFQTCLKMINTCPSPSQVVALPYLFTPKQFEEMKAKKITQADQITQSPENIRQKNKPFFEIAKSIISKSGLIRTKKHVETPIFTSHS